MKTVAQILGSKPDQSVHTVEPTASVYDAVKLMADKNVGALVVTERGKVVGIVSERDYARKVVLLGRSSADTPVSQIMSSPAFTVTPDETVQRCMEIMTERRFRHLPVVNEGQLVGVISIGDCVRAVIDEQQDTIQQLERFISG